jgi:hypothetical protein
MNSYCKTIHINNQKEREKELLRVLEWYRIDWNSCGTYRSDSINNQEARNKKEHHKKSSATTRHKEIISMVFHWQLLAPISIIFFTFSTGPILATKIYQYQYNNKVLRRVVALIHRTIPPFSSILGMLSLILINFWSIETNI